MKKSYRFLDSKVDRFKNFLNTIVNMVLFDIFDIFEYLKISTYGLMNFLVFILLIVVAVSNIKKELGPDCKKGFSRFFVAFLVFLMFSTFFDFAFHLTIKIMYESGGTNYWEYLEIRNILWGVSYGLGFLNLFIAFILLFISMEINLFNKKSKMKFGILSIVLLCGSFLYMIVEIIIFYVFGLTDYELPSGFYFYTISLPYAITQLVVAILTSFNYIIIAMAIRFLLKKTGKENESLKVYTKLISIGVLFLLNFHSIIQIFQSVRSFINYKFITYDYYEYADLLNWIDYGLFFLSSLLFIIGIVVLSIGAVKTMSTPLTFSREKGAKGTPQKGVKKCSECGASIPPLAEFCTNCGHHP